MVLAVRPAGPLRSVQFTLDGRCEPAARASPPPPPAPAPRVPSALLLPRLRAGEEVVTRGDLDHLADVHDPAGFKCVELRPRGCGPRYVGKAFKRPVGPQRETARQAAADVAAFWRGLYGDRWRAYFATRMRHPWELREEPGGFRVVVCVLGKTEYVGRRQLGDVYPDGESAVRAYRAWVRERFGLFAPVAGYYLRRPARAA